MAEGELVIEVDVPGERLVLAPPAASKPGFIAGMREAARSIADGARSLAREVGQRPKSFGDALKSAGLVLVVAVCVALIVVAAGLVVVGAGLVVVLWVIGVWLVAGWLVYAFARRIVRGTFRPGAVAPALRRLDLRREGSTVRLVTGRGARTLAFGDLQGMRALIQPRPGASSALTFGLELGSERIDVALRVTAVDHEEEAAELCFKVARVLGWSTYVARRHRLMGLDLEILPSGRTSSSGHPFRAYVQGGAERAIPAEPVSSESWAEPTEPGFREPDPAVPAFAPGVLPAGRWTVEAFDPGKRVVLEARALLHPRRILRGQIGAALLGAGILASVVVPLNLAAGAPLWALGIGDRESFTGVFAILTGVSVGLGVLSTFTLWWRRVGRVRAVFDWRTEKLTVSDDDDGEDVPLGDVRELVLHESPGSPRGYTLELLAKGRSPIVIFQTSGDHLAPLSMAVGLARALGASWRCVADVEA